MAQAYAKDVKLRLVFEEGMDLDGSPILKRKTFSRIRLDASAEQLHNTAQAFSSLSSYLLLETERIETADIQPV